MRSATLLFGMLSSISNRLCWLFPLGGECPLVCSQFVVYPPVDGIARAACHSFDSETDNPGSLCFGWFHPHLLPTIHLRFTYQCLLPVPPSPCTYAFTYLFLRVPTRVRVRSPSPFEDPRVEVFVEDPWESREMWPCPWLLISPSAILFRSMYHGDLPCVSTSSFEHFSSCALSAQDLLYNISLFVLILYFCLVSSRLLHY